MSIKPEQRIARDLAKMNENIAKRFDRAAEACERDRRKDSTPEQLRILAANYRERPIANDPGAEFKKPPAPEAVAEAEAALKDKARIYGGLKVELKLIGLRQTWEKTKFAVLHPVYTLNGAKPASLKPAA